MFPTPAPQHNPPPFAPPLVTPFGQPALTRHYATTYGPVRPTKGLGVAIITVFWVELAAILLNVAAYIDAQLLLDEIITSARPDPSSIDRLVEAENNLLATRLLTLFIGLAAIILLAVWSNRVAHNAQNRGVIGLSPGLAAGGWFIPFANTVIPFIQLRRAAKPFIGATSVITAWQVCFVWAALISRSGVRDMEEATTLLEFSHALEQRMSSLSLAAALFLVAAICATRSITDINRRVSTCA